uniref:Uncharacterized protein n=1 Tax=Arundo donax TaxID=35708 RepID=A0A0A8ZHA7_ARUDO
MCFSEYCALFVPMVKPARVVILGRS